MSLTDVETLFENRHASLFLEYNIVLNAIPKTWKQVRFKTVIIKHVKDKALMNIVLQNLNNKNKSKLFYKLTSNYSNTKIKAEEKWDNRFKNNKQINWKVIWNFNLKAIRENKIAEFNFKFLHDIIPHKYNLYKWKLSNNPLCSYDDDLHDSIHLFVNCKQTKLFRKKFSDAVAKIYNIRFSFNEYILINGYNLEVKTLHSLNFLIMYAKYAIYATFIQAEYRKVVFHELSMFSIFKKLIRNRLNVEKSCKDKCVLKNT